MVTYYRFFNIRVITAYYKVSVLRLLKNEVGKL